jgi:hypothetical protein
MTVKDETKGKTQSFNGQETGSNSSKRTSKNLEQLDDLLDAWDDEETSGVHIEEMHVHHQTGGYPIHEVPTKPFNKIPTVEVEKPSVRPSISPKARNITLIIVAVATGLATAMKILWEAWLGIHK